MWGGVTYPRQGEGLLICRLSIFTLKLAQILIQLAVVCSVSAMLSEENLPELLRQALQQKREEDELEGGHGTP